MQASESRGLLTALAGFALLSCGDAVVKTMAGQWSPMAIATTRYVLGAAGLSALLLAREGPAAFRMPRLRLQLVRGLSVALATFAFFNAVALMPLAEATAILFTNPIITALLAALVLGEATRRETWIATIAAFAGVLIVLRPNFAVIGWPALLPLVSALGTGVLVIANRRLAGLASPLAMQVYVAGLAAPLMVIVTLAGYLSGAPRFQFGVPDWTVIARCALVAALSSTAHWLIYLGTTRAGAATIAPMIYVQLIVAGTIGWIGFGEAPDLPALAGAALIVASGLYLWRAGRLREAEGLA